MDAADYIQDTILLLCGNISPIITQRYRDAYYHQQQENLEKNPRK